MSFIGGVSNRQWFAGHYEQSQERSARLVAEFDCSRVARRQLPQPCRERECFRVMAEKELGRRTLDPVCPRERMSCSLGRVDSHDSELFRQTMLDFHDSERLTRALN